LFAKLLFGLDLLVDSAHYRLTARRQASNLAAFSASVNGGLVFNETDSGSGHEETISAQ
jgi:hypothetical protein